MTQSRSQPPDTTVPPLEVPPDFEVHSASTSQEIKSDRAPIMVGARILEAGRALVFLGRAGDGQHVFMDSEDFDAGPDPERRSRPLIRRRAAPGAGAWHMDGPVERRRNRRSRWARVR
jgi:hypothetical protein